MGQRGPPPTPTPVLKLRGTHREGRRPNEPAPPVERPTCPSWLNKDAKAVWKQMVPQLERMRVLSAADRNALARYCHFHARWRVAEKFIEENGESYPLKDEKGKVKYLQQFPQVAIAHKLALQLLRLEQEFGLTPAARARIQIDGSQKPGDELDEFLNARKA